MCAGLPPDAEPLPDALLLLGEDVLDELLLDPQAARPTVPAAKPSATKSTWMLRFQLLIRDLRTLGP